MSLPPPSDFPAIRVMMMPRDTNAHGTIFGGVLLSYIDQAGAIEARRHTNQQFVTVSMDKVEFKRPVYVGDVISLHTHIKRIGTTSLTVQVEVTAQRFRDSSEIVPVTAAELVYVCVDANGRPTPHGISTAG